VNTASLHEKPDDRMSQRKTKQALHGLRTAQSERDDKTASHEFAKLSIPVQTKS